MTSEEQWGATRLMALDWPELCEIAKEHGIDAPSTKKRAKLVQMILTKSSSTETGEELALAAPSPTSEEVPKSRSVNVHALVSGESVQIELDGEEEAPVLPTFQFWVGTLPSCPFQNVTAGITFPAWTGAYRGVDSKNEPIPPEKYGTLVSLTEDEIELVISRVKALVVRHMGGDSYTIRSKAGKRFRPAPGDKPMGAFLYMQRVGDGMPHNFQTSGAFPEPLVRI